MISKQRNTSNPKIYLLLIVLLAAFNSCSKFEFWDYSYLDNQEPESSLLKWGQSFNGRWDVYLLVKAMKEAGTPNEINDIYEMHLSKLENAKLYYKYEFYSSSKEINLDIDSLYNENYKFINKSLENRSTMDSLWNIYIRLPKSKDATGKQSFALERRFYTEKRVNPIFKGIIEPVGVTVCSVFKEYQHAAALGEHFIHYTGDQLTCEVSALVSIYHYYIKHAYENVTNDPGICSEHSWNLYELSLELDMCNTNSNSPNDPYPPGGSGGGGGSSGANGSVGTQIIHNTLTAEQTEVFYEMLEVAKISGAYRKLIEYLQSYGEVHIKIIPGENYPHYKPDEKTIVYNYEEFLGSVELFTHEAFHYYQHQVIHGDAFRNYSAKRPGNINIEFEQMVFQDITKSIRGDNNFIGILFKQSQKEGFSDAKGSYQNWILEITNNGAIYPNLNEINNFRNEYMEHLGEFKEYGHLDYTNTDIIPTLGPDALIHFYNGDVDFDVYN